MGRKINIVVVTPPYLVGVLSKYFHYDKVDSIITNIIFRLLEKSVLAYYNPETELLTMNDKMNILYFALDSELFNIQQDEISFIVEHLDTTINELLKEIYLACGGIRSIVEVYTHMFHTRLTLYE